MTFLRSKFVLYPVGICLAAAAVLIAGAQDRCAGEGIFTEKICVGDGNSAEEQALFELVNKYRIANGKAQIRLSPTLSMVANRHLLDLNRNVKSFTHSWSNCPYDIIRQSTWPCINDAPKRLNSGYVGQGYETLYRTANGTASPSLALDAWKKSSLHNSIILNGGMFAGLPWDEVGIAIDGQYAALWFGTPGAPADATTGIKGSPTSYERASAGLQSALTVSGSQAMTADRKVVVDLSGPNREVIGLLLQLEGGKLSAQTRSTGALLLRNIFPEWLAVDLWLDGVAAAVSDNATASRTKLVDKIAVEAVSGGPNMLRIKLVSKGSGVVEM